MGESERILVGVVGAPQGIRGEVRVKSFTADPLAVGGYGTLSNEDGTRTFDLLGARRLKDDMIVVRFAGVSDRDAAMALTNVRLYVDRARLPAPEMDEFYQVDLIGLAAKTETGRDLGRVTAVENYGAGDLLEIGHEAGELILVPFTKDFVPSVDLENRRVVIAEGALGLGDEPEAR